MRYSVRYRVARVLKKIGFSFDVSENAEVAKMKETLNKLKGRKIIFELEFDKDGNWGAESVNLPGIVTGGNFREGNIYDMISDAIFTYFNIPPEYCDDSLLMTSTKTSKEKAIFSYRPVPALT